MAIIDPEGLFGGDRIGRLTDRAKLMWPYFFVAANGYARLEVEYRKLMKGPLRPLSSPPSEADVAGFFREYHNNYLAFLYLVSSPTGDQVWAQFWAKEGTLKRYKSAEDEASPPPPKDEFSKWMDEYRSAKTSNSMVDLIGIQAVKVAAPAKRKSSARVPIAQWPKTADLLNRLFPGTPDAEALIGRIVVAMLAKDKDLSDEQVFDLLGSAHKRARGRQKSMALFLQTGPQEYELWLPQR